MIQLFFGRWLVQSICIQVLNGELLNCIEKKNLNYGWSRTKVFWDIRVARPLQPDLKNNYDDISN